MIRNIVWDMGNVLADWNSRKIAANLPIKDENRQIILEEVFYSVEWIRFDAGDITREEFINAVKARTNESVWDDIETALDHWYEYSLDPIPETEELARKLKAAGYPEYVLSNANVMMDLCKDRIPAFRLMNGLYFSAFYKMMKPEARIYQSFLETYHLKAEECVFIDDNRVNVAGAVIQHMKGIEFKNDIKKLEEDLRQLGVEW